MKKLIFLIGALAVSLAASIFLDAAPTRAHMTCGNGMTFNPAHTPTNGQPACIPANDWSAPAPSTSHGRWETRWGAFAGDSESGKIGRASGMSSRTKAEKAAIAHCQSKGGQSCRVEISYNNQCGVVAYGGGYMNTASAATLEESTEIAIRRCSKNASDCRIVFSDCSYAEFVQ